MTQIMGSPRERWEACRRVQEEHRARVDAILPILIRLDTSYAHYPLRWLVRKDGSMERIGVTGMEVGIHHFREMGWLPWPGGL